MADLVTRLLLNKSNFDTNIQQSARELMEMKRKSESLSKGLNSVGASFGKIAGAVGIAMSATEMLSSMASRMKELVDEGIRMAEVGDGIKHAFSQIGSQDLLQGLRDATHGTVNDLELMKAAVQANDFRIPLEQLGKYMEFAQLKASQTGQSVDYLTQSIVTGLGRQSVMILDNLGLSAAEIKEQMAGGASMAEAVGKIIDKQLSEVGQHYETAAERATRKTVELQNAQIAVGEQLLPLKSAWSDFLTSVEIDCMNVIAKLGAMFSEAQRIKNLQTDMFGGGSGSGKSRADRELAYFNKIGTEQSQKNFITNNVSRYNKQINKLSGDIAKLKQTENVYYGHHNKQWHAAINQKIKDLELEREAYRAERDKFIAGAKIRQTPTFTPVNTPKSTPHKGGGGGGGKTGPVYAPGSMGYNDQQISALQQQMKFVTDPDSLAKIQKQIDDFKAKNETMELQAKVIMQGTGSKGVGVSDTKGMMDDMHKEITKRSSTIGKDMEDVAYKMQLPMVQTMRKMKGFETKVLEPYKQFSENAGEIINGVQGIDMMVSSIGNLVTSIENGANAWEIFMGVVNTVSSVIQGIGMVMETVNTIMELTGTTATTTASQQAAASGTVIAAKTGEAIAGAAAGGAMMPFPYSLIAIAAGIAAVLAALSMIGGFAEGGTVGGSSWTGDKLLARVNSGERILPAKKAKALDDMMAAGPAVVIPDVRLKGSDLWLSFNNENKLRSKVGRGFKG